MQKLNKNKDLKGFIKSIWKEAWGRTIIAVLVMAISLGSGFSLLLSNTRAVDKEFEITKWEQMQSALKELKEGDKATFILKNDLTAKDCIEIGEGISVTITSNSPAIIYSEDEKLAKQTKKDEEEQSIDKKEQTTETEEQSADKEEQPTDKKDEKNSEQSENKAEKPVSEQAFFRVVGEGKLDIEKSVSLSGGKIIKVAGENRQAPAVNNNGDRPIVSAADVQIEKYVNKNVHADLNDISDTFTYDILVYIPDDAISAVISDTLPETLDFVDRSAITVSNRGTSNNHQVGATGTVSDTTGTPLTENTNYTISGTGGELTITLIGDGTNPLALQNKWIQISFAAKINTTSFSNIAELKAHTSFGKVNDNGTVKGGLATHTGVKNNATVTVNNSITASSNVVTVVSPENTQIEKYINKAVHKDISLNDSFEYDILAYVPLNANKFTVSDNFNANAIERSGEVRVYNVGESNNSKPLNDMGGNAISGNENATVGIIGTDITSNATISTTGGINVTFNDATAYRGDWIRINFSANINSAMQKNIREKYVSDPTNAFSDLENEYRPVDTNGTVDFSGSHTGVINSASATVNEESATLKPSNSVTLAVDKNNIPDEPNLTIIKNVEGLEHKEVGVGSSNRYKYNIIVYIPFDAKKVTIVDNNISPNSAITASRPVTVYDLGTSNYGSGVSLGTANRPNVTTIPEGEEYNYGSFGWQERGYINLKGVSDINIEIGDKFFGTTDTYGKVSQDLRGHWVRFEFDAYVNGNNFPSEHTIHNGHEGIPNTASYTVTRSDDSTDTATSNTVTVKSLEIEKYINNALHVKNADINGSFEYELLAYVPEFATELTITDELGKGIDFATLETSDVFVYAVDESSDHLPLNDEDGNTINLNATVGKNGTDITANVDIEKNIAPNTAKKTLSVTVPENVITDNSLKGKSIKVVFKARFAQDFKSGLKTGTIAFDDLSSSAYYQSVSNNYPVENSGSHEGVGNRASYTVKSADNKTSTISSNTVTVTPDKNSLPTDEPHIEKYINKAVHQEIAVDKVVDYDILAYVPLDADIVTITDTLPNELEFVEGAGIMVYDLGIENNHLPVHDINGQVITTHSGGAIPTVLGESGAIANLVTPPASESTLKVKLENPGSVNANGLFVPDASKTQIVTKLRCHWIKVSFKAQIKKSMQQGIRLGTITPSTESVSDNGEIQSTETHSGIVNQASYEAYSYSADHTYRATSNRTTVINSPNPPDHLPSIEKYVNKAVHSDIKFYEVVELDIIAYIPRDANSVVITDSLPEEIEYVIDDNIHQLLAYELDKEANHLPYRNADGSVISYNSTITPSVILGGNDVTDKISHTSSGQQLTINIANAADLREKWVRINFFAQIKPSIQANIINGSVDVSALTGTDIDGKNGSNSPIHSGDAHSGLGTSAAYRVTAAAATYNGQSNKATVSAKTESPEIEKYVNKAVHTDIDIAVNKEIEYDLIAYITYDADEVVITDSLIDELEILGDETDVEIFDIGSDNNHLPVFKVNGDAYGYSGGITPSVLRSNLPITNADVNILDGGKTLRVNLLDEINSRRGHYIRINFKVRPTKTVLEEIKSGEKTAADYVDFVAVDSADNKGISDEEHSGLKNSAKYAIKVGALDAYTADTNIVTVNPYYKVNPLDLNKDDNNNDGKGTDEDLTSKLINELSAKTGDDIMLFIYLAVATVAVGIIAVIQIIRKKTAESK